MLVLLQEVEGFEFFDLAAMRKYVRSSVWGKVFTCHF